jgi:DNA-binding NtrC family response regulator
VTDSLARSWPPVAASSFRRTVLLVESDPDLADVLVRVLGRRRNVVVAPSIARAMTILSREPRIHSLVVSYKLSDGTAARLFCSAQRRWPHVRRVLYADPARARRRAKLLAHVVVDVQAPFETLFAAVD